MDSCRMGNFYEAKWKLGKVKTQSMQWSSPSLHYHVLGVHCLLACLFCIPSSQPHSSVSMNLFNTLTSQCCFDRCLEVSCCSFANYVTTLLLRKLLPSFMAIPMVPTLVYPPILELAYSFCRHYIWGIVKQFKSQHDHFYIFVYVLMFFLCSHSNGGMELRNLPVSVKEERSLVVIQGLTLYNKVS